MIGFARRAQRWILTAALLLATLSSSPVEAQDPSSTGGAERITSVRRSRPAPFDGVLLNLPAAARLLIDTTQREAQCQIELDRQLGLQRAGMQLQIDTEVSRREALQTLHDEMIALRDRQIDDLTARLRPPEWYESGEFWFGVGTALGLVVGVAVSVLIVYALNQAGGSGSP